MKLLTFILVLLIYSQIAFARVNISDSERNTYNKLMDQKIVMGLYTEAELNQPMSRIDVFSLTIKTKSNIDTQLRTKANAATLGHVKKELNSEISNLKAEIKTLKKADEESKLFALVLFITALVIK